MTTNNEIKNETVTKDKKRTYIFDGKVTEENIRKMVEHIFEINKHDEEQKAKDKSYVANPIKIYFSTVGGNVYEANMGISAIEESETPIYTYCYSKAMSSGFYMFLAGHKRFASPLATFMYHDATIGLHNTITGLQDDLNHYVNVRDAYDEYILSKTNLSKEMLDEFKRTKTDMYLLAKDAYKYGIIDEIIQFPQR
jgi:ATP-dependent Clp protease, protease subunit